MNIVYLIGNGFDLSVGLPTAYSDFYKYYLSQNTEDEEIIKFKKSIETTPDYWSDLEKALGQYTINLDTEEKINAIHKDLINNLKTYLKGVEADYDCDDSQSVLINQDLIFPEKKLFATDQQSIDIFKSKWSNVDSWQLKIITFNYTAILEKLIGFKTGQEKKIGISKQNRNIFLKEIEHIHGSILKNMALGLNDISQFSNETFHDSRILKNKYIKHELNKVARTGHDEVCQVWIKGANLICVFGLSFGITDLRWWQYIGDRLKGPDVLLILFYHIKNLNVDELEPAELFEEEVVVKNFFLNRTSLSDTDKEQVREKIFVSINSSMFKIDNDKFTYKL